MKISHMLISEEFFYPGVLRKVIPMSASVGPESY